jgi:hypothetical protein
MASSFTLRYEERAERERAARRLAAVTLAGRPAFSVQVLADGLAVDVALREPLSGNEPIEIGGTATRLRARDLFVLASRRSTVHTPRGVLWTRGGLRFAAPSAAEVPLESLAPAILAWFGAAGAAARAS